MASTLSISLPDHFLTTASDEEIIDGMKKIAVSENVALFIDKYGLMRHDLGHELDRVETGGAAVRGAGAEGNERRSRTQRRTVTHGTVITLL